MQMPLLRRYFIRAHMLLLQQQKCQLLPAKYSVVVIVDNYFNQVYTPSFTSFSDFQRGFISGNFPMETLPRAA